MKLKVHNVVCIIFVSLCFLFFWISTAPATLIDLGNGVTKDDKNTLTPVDDQYWIKDLNRFVGMTYDEQITAIDNLDSQGLSNITSWHMATYADILTLWNFYEIQEIAESFVPTTVGLPGEDYRHWNGRYDRVFLPIYHYEVNISYSYGNYSGGLNVRVADHEIFPGAFVTAYALQAPTIDAILNFFDTSVADGSLTGDGRGNSANGRLNALRNMLEMAGDLIAIDDIEGACRQLDAALKKCDGSSPPPDFVTGPAVSELYDLILELMDELGCE